MTGNDVIEEAIRILLGGSREEMNQLATSYYSSDPTMPFLHPLGGIREGAQICIDLEMFRVWSVDDTTQSATVQPGMNGTETASHNFAALVYVNPRFPRYAVLDAMNKEIMALSSPSNGLYQMATAEFVYEGSVSDYPIPADAIDIYDVYLSEPGPSGFWPRLPHWSWNPLADTTDYPTGKSLHVPYGTSGRTVRVVYKKAFTPVANPTLDLATAAGLPLEMQDILALGVLMRLGPSREIKRNFIEAQSGDSRRADEVQAGSTTNSFAWVRNQRTARITEERSRLERLYPPRYPAL